MNDLNEVSDAPMDDEWIERILAALDELTRELES